MVTDFKKNKKVDASKTAVLILGIILLVGLCIYVSIATFHIYQKKKELLSEMQDLQKQIQDIKAKNNQLQLGISNTDNSQYIEKVAREELDLQKPGEKVVSFIMPSPEPQKTTVEKKNTFQVWLSYLGNTWQWIKRKL